MSLSIEFPDGNYLFFDAVLNYSGDYKSQITKHPVDHPDGSRNIADHTYTENPVISFSAIISNADFNTNRPQGWKYLTFNPVLDTVTIKVNDNALISMLPDSVSQFFDVARADVTFPEMTKIDSVNAAKDALLRLRNGAILGTDGKPSQLVKIHEFELGKLKRTIENCYITSLTFSEDAETGDSVKVDMSLEMITFVKVEEAIVKGNLFAQVNKGKQDSKVAPLTDQNKPKLPNKSPLRRTGEFVFDAATRSF